MSRWLLTRLFEVADQPKPRFAFQGTVNWMRALALITASEECSDDALRVLYRDVQRRTPIPRADTTVFESLFMSFNHLAGLTAVTNDVSHGCDACRTAVMTWYYVIYFAANGMIAACSGGLQSTHAATARVWQADIVRPGLVLKPFGLMLTSLVGSACDEQIAAYRGSNRSDLNQTPEGVEQAWGALVSYLKGTGEFERWKIEEKVKASRAFMALGVDSFRSRSARDLRDEFLERAQVNFLVQAIRYRGKANYRDSLFLSYGDDRSALIEQFLVDLAEVAGVFLRMAATYCSRRVERGTWLQFVEDVEQNSQLSLPVDVLRV